MPFGEGKSVDKSMKSPENLSLAEKVRRFTEIACSSVAQRQGIMEMNDNFLLLEINNIARTNDEASLEEYAKQNKDQLKKIILRELDNPILDKEDLKAMLDLIGENVVMKELYVQLGKKYVLGGNSETTTDCVQILRSSKHFKDLVDSNPLRFFSEGSDLVLHENLGKVRDVVDRKNFADLNRYRPTKDKMYVFALVKPPLYLGGKPNVTHLQIATDLQNDPKKLAIIHASSDHGQVVIEPDVGKYLAGSHFERVYVIEVDLNNPYVKDPLEREPRFEVQGYHSSTYERPHIYDIPLVLDNFSLISEDNKKVEIYSEEKNTLELMSNNRALSYLTVLTGIREGEIGNKQNILEELAFRIYADPTGHSLGLHQVTKIVLPLVNKWLRGIDEKLAKGLGIHKLWKKRHDGKDVMWSEITPLLTTYNISDGRYSDVKMSTICAYLLIKHLYEDQLLSAYSAYGETFFGLEEQPEAVIALAAAYRSNMSVLIRGAQQYRIAEMAKELGVIDADFNFTDECKGSDEYSRYVDAIMAKKGGRGDFYMTNGMKRESARNSEFGKKFLVDGYAGMQTSFVAYMCYKKLYPHGEMSIGEFKKAYDGNLNNLLKGKVPDLMKEEYKKKFGARPRLLMTEEELRKEKTLKFANEGLWAISHYRKMAEENWNAINSDVDKDGHRNPIMEDELKTRSYLTNETSKIPSEKIQRFYTLIQQMPGNPFYKGFPDYILSACFVRGFFLEEGKEMRDGQWIHNVQAFINDIFIKNAQKFRMKMPPNLISNDRALMKLCALSSIMSVDEVVKFMTTGEVLSPKTNRQIEKLNSFSKSFYVQRMRYLPENAEPLLKYAEIREKKNAGKGEFMDVFLQPDLTEKEQQEAFPLRVFDLVQKEAKVRGFGLNFALVVTAMATLECGWGQEKNRFNEPTLFAGANNILSIKYNTKQYSKEDYDNQSKDLKYYIYHTVEYFSGADKKQSTEHFEAFRKYENAKGCVEDFFSLIERKYPLTVAAAKKNAESLDPSSIAQREILECLLKEKYATDPKYVDKALSLAGSVEKILRKYGQLI